MAWPPSHRDEGFDLDLALAVGRCRGVSQGVWGSSPQGHGVHGESSTGWAGYFDGRVLVNKYVELKEIGMPSAPGSNGAKLFIRDNGSGKTQPCVRFATGAVRVLATQP